MDSSSMIIRDEDFQKTMAQVVEPYLAARRTDCFLQREQGKKLYCVFYEAQIATIVDDEASGYDQTVFESSGQSMSDKEEMRNHASRSVGQPKGIMIVSHGFTETAEKFYEVIYYFLRAGYHVAALDHHGHGHSYRLTDKDLFLVHTDGYWRYLADLEFLTDRAKERWPQLPVYLYAHSMGGGMGAALAAKKPQLYDKVILTSPMIKPLTAGIPWGVTKVIAYFFCGIGKGEDYVLGQRPFVPNSETFENSASASRERFAYYQHKREGNLLYQMSAPSYAWFREAIRLNHFLMTDGVKQLSAPLLLFQSEEDSFVSREEQVAFIDKINEYRKIAGNPAPARLAPVPKTRHEIYNSGEKVWEFYWMEMEHFLME